MNIRKYENKTKEEIERAIKVRREQQEAVRWQKDEHYKDWHFEKGQEYRNLEKNIQRLEAIRRRLFGEG